MASPGIPSGLVVMNVDEIPLCIETFVYITKKIYYCKSSLEDTYNSTAELRFTNASHHEQIFRTKNVSGDERCLE
jgi:hypothetical protein